MLQVGDVAPDFALRNQDGAVVRLVDFRGKRLVIYFYPKDDTADCIKEACAFRDKHQEFLALGVILVGISCDSPQDHRSFSEKYHLPYLLLCDPNIRVANRWGAFGEIKAYGRRYRGIHRVSFIIDEQGKIVHIFHNLPPADHANRILARLKEIDWQTAPG